MFNMKSNLDGRDPVQLAKERERRKRQYARAHDNIKTKLITEMVKEGWRPK